jgi:hypothetical protein
LVSNERDLSDTGTASDPGIEYVPQIAEPTSYIPVKFVIQDPHDIISKKIDAIKMKTRRTATDKTEMMSLIKAGIIAGIIDVVDHNLPPIDPSNYTLTEFRCYTKSDDDSEDESKTAKNDNWRFKSYHDHIDQRQPFENGELTTGQCGLYCSTHIHVHSKNGHRHYPMVMYMLFSK